MKRGSFRVDGFSLAASHWMMRRIDVGRIAKMACDKG